MVLARLAHYTFDVVLLSTIVAGVRRSSGFTLVTFVLFLYRVNVLLPDLMFLQYQTRLWAP
jgi:hypothetical protein